MHIVFDLDNTLSDEMGKNSRPGIEELLEKLKSDGHRLSVWTSSTRKRALIVLNDLGLRKYFTDFIFREDYDPENLGVIKDIRRVNGDCLIDDDPKHVNFTKSVGKKAFLVRSYRGGLTASLREMDELYKFIRRASGIFRFWFK